MLALAVFLPQLSDQSMVLMSDNATVMAYLRNLMGNVPHGQQGCSMDRTSFCHPVRLVHSRQEEHPGGSAELSRSGLTDRVVSLAKGV